jgi:hypothetical protein
MVLYLAHQRQDYSNERNSEFRMSLLAIPNYGLNLGGSLSDLSQQNSRFQFKNRIQHSNSNAASNARS